MAWKRMVARGDEGAPPIGARMPFVIVADNYNLGGKDTQVKLYDRAEHPDYVRSNSKLKLDTPYYIESLFNPLQKLLQFCDVEDLRAIFKIAIERASNKLKNISSLKRFSSGVNDESQSLNPTTFITNPTSFTTTNPTINRASNTIIDNTNDNTNHVRVQTKEPSKKKVKSMSLMQFTNK
jgi:hypothetical protein